MQYNVIRVPTWSEDRTKGERIAVAGASLRVLSLPPIGAELALNSSSGARIRIARGDVICGPFSELWLFHREPSPSNFATWDPLELLISDGFAGGRGAELGEGWVFNQVLASASGNTAIVSGITGYRVRIGGYRFELTANATLAAAGTLDIALRSGLLPPDFGGVATPFIAGIAFPTWHRVYLPTAAPSGAFGSLDTGLVMLPGQGILTKIGAGVDVALTAALTAGGLIATVAYQHVLER